MNYEGVPPKTSKNFLNLLRTALQTSNWSLDHKQDTQSIKHNAIELKGFKLCENKVENKVETVCKQTVRRQQCSKFEPLMAQGYG